SFVEVRVEDTLKKLQSKAGIDKLREEVYKTHSGWDNMVLDIGFDRIVISSVNLAENKKYQSKNIACICEEYGYEDEIEFVSKLLISENGKVSIIVMSMTQEDVDTIAKVPYISVISDSLYGAPDCPHPRLYGSFSKIIRDYVNERKILTFEEAIHKMTAMTAKRFSLSNRGIIKEGYIADLNIFSRSLIIDKATFETPKQLSCGMDYVLIDGKIAYENKMADAKYGKAVRCK
ncbi:MAG: amidohydrolase family protein, partial [Oscillospiraceae bacterium]